MRKISNFTDLFCLPPFFVETRFIASPFVTFIYKHDSRLPLSHLFVKTRFIASQNNHNEKTKSILRLQRHAEIKPVDGRLHPKVIVHAGKSREVITP